MITRRFSEGSSFQEEVAVPRKRLFHSRKRKAEGASRAEEGARPPYEAWPQRERAARGSGGLGQSGTPSARHLVSTPLHLHRAQPQSNTPILTPHGGRGQERGALRRLPGMDTSGLSRAAPCPSASASCHAPQPALRRRCSLPPRRPIAYNSQHAPLTQPEAPAGKY